MAHDDWSYAEYWSYVQRVAREHLDSLLDGTVTDASDHISAEVDGSAWVTYYAGARAVMQHTDNDDAAYDSMGRDAFEGCESFNDVCARFAFSAMEADIHDTVGRYRDEYPGEADPDTVQGYADDAMGAVDAGDTYPTVTYVPQTGDTPPDVYLSVDTALSDADAETVAAHFSAELPAAYEPAGGLRWGDCTALCWRALVGR